MIYPTVSNIIGGLCIAFALTLFTFALFLICDAVRRKIYERRFDAMQKRIAEEFKEYFEEIKK